MTSQAAFDKYLHIGAPDMGYAPRTGRMFANTIVVMGNSVISNGVTAAFNSTSPVSYNSRDIFSHANRRLGLPFVVLNVAGVSGQTTAQIYARWGVSLSPYNPGIVVWESGINDFSAGRTAEQVLSDIRVAHQRAIDEGRRFIYLGMPGLLFGGQPGPQRTKFLAMCRTLARLDPTFEFIDIASRMLDFGLLTPASAAVLGDGQPLANAAPDAVHPSAYGALLCSDAIVDYFNDRGYPYVTLFSPYGTGGNGGAGITQGSSGSPTTGDYLTNIALGGLMGGSGTGGKMNNAQPSNSRTLALSFVDRANTGLQARIPGKLFRAEISPNVAPADTNFVRIGLTQDASSMYGRGRTFQARGYCKATSTGGNIHSLALVADVLSWDYATQIILCSDNQAFDLGSLPTWSMRTTSYEGMFETRPFTIPVTLTQAHLYWSFQVSMEAAATVTLDTTAIEVREVFNF